MALSWLVCDFVTGNVLTDLPDVALQGALRQTIGQYEQNTLTMPLSTAPVEWPVFTRPYAVNLIALDESGAPIWGGPITQRPRDQGDSIAFPVASGEAYFDRRYISPLASASVVTTPDYGYYAGWDQCRLVADLATRYAATGAKQGMPLRVQWTASAQPLVTHVYSDSDDKTLYSGMQDLSATLHGPEWTLSWEWQHNPERITPVLTVADRLGSAPPFGNMPNAMFYLPGSVSAVTLLEDYTAGKGANDITAVGPGQGNSRPSFRQVASNMGGRPTIEFRFNVPAIGALTTAQIAALRGYATQALAYMGDGAQALTLTADVNDPGTPVLGVDWNIGDDVGYQIGGISDATGLDLVPAFPGGISGVARTIGAERTDTTVTPIIWLPNPTLTAGSF